MSDLLLQWNADNATADLVIADGDLALDNSFDTAVLISLMQDGLAQIDAVPPGADRRGDWADYLLPALPDGSADTSGSLLWLLKNALQTTETLRLAESYAITALDWMPAVGAAESIAAVATYPALNMMALSITISRGASSKTYDYAWNLQ